MITNKDRFRDLRARAMEMARKHKQAGHALADIRAWVGHAYYWHVCLMRSDLTGDAMQDAVYARAARYGVRNAAAVNATAAAALAGMNIRSKGAVS